MKTLIGKKTMLVAGLITAFALPGLANADSRSKYSLKERASERVEHHGSRHVERERYARYDRRDRREERHQHRHDRGRHYGHHYRHVHGYWQRHPVVHHHAGHYRHDHGGLHISGIYLTPNLGLSLHLGH
jgi:hypothetical protein